MKQTITHCVGILIAALFIAACQSTPTRPPLEIDEFPSVLEANDIPFTDAFVENGVVVVKMNYGVESNPPSRIRYDSDVKSIAQSMCNYAYGYGLKVEYADEISTSINWHVIRDYCLGTVPADKLVSTFDQPTSIAPY